MQTSASKESLKKIQNLRPLDTKVHPQNELFSFQALHEPSSKTSFKFTLAQEIMKSVGITQTFTICICCHDDYDKYAFSMFFSHNTFSDLRAPTGEAITVEVSDTPGQRATQHLKLIPADHISCEVLL